MYPIVVTVYDRVDLLDKCIQSLKSNKEAADSVIYISSDFPYQESDVDKVSEVREYIKNIVGFKKVFPIFHEKNIGSFKAHKYAIECAFKESSACIFMEDDIVVSKYFLKYMNTCLDLYENDESVFFICSYIWPGVEFSDLTENDIFLWRSYCPWGMGTWKRKWQQIDLELSNIDVLFSDKRRLKEFRKIDPNTIEILYSDLAGRTIATDARISLYMYMNQKYSVFPVKTMCVNRGHDGRGVNGSTNDLYMMQEMVDYDPFVESSIGFMPLIEHYIYKKKRHGFLKRFVYYPLLRYSLFLKLRLFLKRKTGL